MRGLCPRAPGIYRFGPEWLRRRAASRRPAIPALGRRSGRFPALPYLPPR
jgi:hypothetical protein